MLREYKKKQEIHQCCVIANKYIWAKGDSYQMNLANMNECISKHGKYIAIKNAPKMLIVPPTVARRFETQSQSN